MGILSDRQLQRLCEEKGMITPFSPMQKRPGVISFGVSSMGYDVRLGYKFKVFKSYPHDEIDPKAFNPDLLEDVDLTPRDNHKWVAAGTDRNGNPVMEHCSVCFVDRKNEFQDRWLAACLAKQTKFIRIPPHSFALGESLEWFDIPRDILVVCLGKSTYARCGLIVNVTPGEPEWPGHWTIEMSNTTPLPIRVYAGEGIMQCLFFRSDERDRATEEALVDHLARHDDNGFRLLSSRLAAAGCGVSYKDKKGKYTDQSGLTLPKVD